MSVIADMIRAGVDPDLIARVHEEIVAAARGSLSEKSKPDEPRRFIPPELRQDVLKRDGHRCVYCGSDGGGASLHCDHVVPISRGGATVADNLVASCRPCNTSKKDRTPDEWRRA